MRISVADGNVRLVVADNGRGIPADAPPGHGLRNLAERAEALGGSLSVISASGFGTTVEWDVPVA